MRIIKSIYAADCREQCVNRFTGGTQTYMSYSTTSILALAVLLIINRDILFESRMSYRIPAQEDYRRFLCGVTLYYVTDILWGIFSGLGLITALWADTSVYFVAMVLSILLWTRFVVNYLDARNFFGRLMNRLGWTFFAIGVICVTVNLFRPFLFTFDETGEYQALPARYVLLS